MLEYAHVLHKKEVREEIAQTVADPAEVQEEIRYLLGVLGS